MSKLGITPDKWRSDNPGIVRTSHIAVGNQADVDGTGPVNSAFQDALGVFTWQSTQAIQEIFTGTPSVFNTGLNVKAVANFSSDPDSFGGIDITAATAAGGANNITYMYGNFPTIAHRGTGTTQKIGFFNAAPIARPAALTTQLTSITHTAPGTPDYAIQDLTNAGGYGFATKDEGNTVLSVILNLQTRVAELEAKLSSSSGLGLIA